MRSVITGVLLVVVLLAGCGQKTTLILLPDESGETKGAVLKTDEGEVVIENVYSYSTISAGGVLPSLPREISAEQVAQSYGRLLEAEPPAPVSYLLYFTTGTTTLTSESEELLPDVLRSVDQDMPVEISIIGHTDSVGKKEYNLELSLKRANAVKKMLLEVDPSLSEINIQSHGENDPLIQTQDNVAEPRNRRVEIMIR